MAATVAQRIGAHFDSQGPREILVPEWGEGAAPLLICVEPMTVSELQQIKAAGEDGSLEFLVRAIVLKAREESGARMFSRGDIYTLMHEAAAWVVQRVALEILDQDSPGEDELGN